MNPLVSILIPAYNAERWIKETVTSALDQTWARKEIIVVDDGSTDNTADIIRRFDSPIIKLLSQPNGGSCAARNKALSLAQGDYIQWLDHDDLLHPEKLSEQMKIVGEETGSRILFSGSFGRFYFRPEKAEFRPDRLWQDLSPIEYFLIKFNDNTWLHPTAWLVSRNISETAGPWLDLRTPDDDGEYFFRVVAASERIKYVPAARSYWRIGNFGSLSNQMSREALRARFTSMRLCMQHLMSIEDSERTRSACLEYLRTWLPYFYPEQDEIMREIEALSRELGRELPPPTLSPKYRLLKDLFGWTAAKRVMFGLRKTRTTAVRSWDRLMYKLSM